MKVLSFCLSMMTLIAGIQASADAVVRKEFLCESINQKSRTCQIESDWGRSRWSSRIEFRRQVSSASCIYGRTYFLNGNDSVTVTNGCRAVFAGDLATDRVTENDRILRLVGDRSFTMRCESVDHRIKRCLIPWHRIQDVDFEQQHSSGGAPCIEGASYQTDGHSIAVWNGCRATFRVRGW